MSIFDGDIARLEALYAVGAARAAHAERIIRKPRSRLSNADIVPVRIGLQSRIHAFKGAQSYPEADFFFFLADVRKLF